MKKHSSFSNDEIWMFIAQSLIGLSEIHNKSIVHRDLKPLNIFKVGEFYKIADLGISKNLGNTVEMARTQCGTPL